MTAAAADYIHVFMVARAKCECAYTIGDKVIPCELSHGHDGRHYGHLWADQEATVMWGQPVNVTDEDIPF